MSPFKIICSLKNVPSRNFVFYQFCPLSQIWYLPLKIVIIQQLKTSFYREIKRKLSPFSHQDVWVGISTDDYYFTLLDGRKMTEVDLLYNWDRGQPGRGSEIVAGIRYGRTLHDFSGRKNVYGVCERIVES